MKARKLVGMASLGLAAMVMGGQVAQGVSITQSATVNVRSISAATQGPNPPLQPVEELGFANGLAITNTRVVQGPGLFAPGAIISVGTALFNGTDFHNGNTGVNGVRAINGQDDLVVADFAILGRLVAPGVAKFTVGGAVFVDGVANGSWDPENPATWGFNTNNIIGQLRLKTEDEIAAVLTGPNGDDIGDGVPANEVNLSAANLAIPDASQGQLVFKETFEAFDGTLLDENTQNFFDVIGPPSNALGEGMYVFLNQTGQGQTNLIDFSVQANRDAVNDLAQYLTGVDFANFGSGNADDYFPTPTGVPTGDFQTGLTITANPISWVPAVPEPVSASLAMMGLGALGMATRRRMA